ncbi:MAG: M20 family metallopeptidase [Fidelibacterota bacterium]
MAKNIHPDISALRDEIITIRRDIHQHPELGFEVQRTAGLVARHLETLGLEVKTEVGKTGVVGDLNGTSDGPTIALRADMDALPIQETGDVSYKSLYDGRMHACGHDGHTAILLGVANVLAANRDKLKGAVRFIFQPAEEGEGGARYMINDGVLDGVDEIYGLHLWNYQVSGDVGVKEGPVLASADIFTIHIRGIGGHGATPQGTVDCIVVAAQVIQAVQTIVSRNTNPLESTVVTIGKVTGGHNFNVIADEVTLSGTARAYSEENRQLIKQRLGEILNGIATTFGADITLDYEDGYPPTINESETTKKLDKAARTVVGEEATFPYLSMGGEDFAYYLNEIPGCFFFVGSAPRDRALRSIPHHCSHFDIDEEALLIGGSIFVRLIEQQLY